MKSTFISGAGKTNAASNMAKISFLFIFAMFLAVSASPAFAQHDPIITLSPDIANCNQLGDTFTVNILNNVSSSDSIYEVRIYSGTLGITNFSCGSAPSGWTLFDHVQQYGYCEYKTEWNNNSTIIKPGNSKIFTFDAVMWSQGCISEFLISTLDNNRPIGQQKFTWPQVRIDCSNPQISKIVGDPKLLGTGFDWWVTTNTNIHLDASDNNEDCDLGLDYCRWRVTLDGVPGDWNTVENGETLDWDLKFVGDSNHYLEVECYDLAGNKKVLTETDKVDSTPPVTTKIISEPKKIDGNVEWIDTVTTITLNAVDPDPTGHSCNIGVDKTWYKNVLAEGEDSCWDPAQYCNAIEVSTPYGNPKTVYCINEAQAYCDENWESEQDPNWEACVEDYVHEECQVDPNWHLYDGNPINKDQESCHELYYFSVDNLGNVENTNVNCFFVDKKPPVVDKEVGDPSVTICGPGEGNEITVFSEDFESGATGWTHGMLEPREGYNSSDWWEIRTTAYGIDNYDFGTTVYGTTNHGSHGGYEHSYLMSPVIALPGDDIITLEFDSYTANEGGCPDWYDVEWIEISSDGGQTWATLNTCGGVNVGSIGTLSNEPPVRGVGISDVQTSNGDDPLHNDSDMQWRTFSYDISAYAGEDVQVRFRYDTGDGCCGPDNQEGWYTDNIKIYSEMSCEHYVTQETPITFTCTDPEPHPSGDEEICFKVSYDYVEVTPGVYEWGYNTDTYCDPEDMTADDYCCVPATSQNPFVFNFQEESMHNLEYYCKDAVEKKSETHIQYYKVDDTPPSIEKTMIGTDHLGYTDGELNEDACPPKSEDDDCYVRDNDENGVHIAVKDGGEICAVNNVQCTYKLIWQTTEENCAGRPYENGWCTVEAGQFGEDGQDILFQEDSTHKLVINCKDALGNAMAEDVETFLVDSTPPETTKTYGEPFVEEWYPKECYLIDELNIANGDFNEVFNEVSCGWAHWITSNTPVTLDATDEKVGVDKIYWRNMLVTNNEEGEIICQNSEADGAQFDGSNHCNPEYYDQYVNLNTPWNEYDGSFYKPEESCHVIEYYSVDKLGNEEPVKWQCVFVDNTPPEVNKTIGEPKVVRSEGQDVNQITYITNQTPITLTCKDAFPHPVDHVSLWYRYRFNESCDNLDGSEWTAWVDPNGGDLNGNPYLLEKIIHFPEDSCHELEYYCVDGLGNTGPINSEIDIVDTQPPVINKTIVGPRAGACPPENLIEIESLSDVCADDLSVECAQKPKCYIDGVTQIHVEAVDPEPHPVNNVTCDWDYTVYGGQKIGSGQIGVIAPFDINFPEESKHKLTITCRDELGNSVTDRETFYVDKTPPVTSKHYGEPYYNNETSKWVTSETNIALSVEDAGPHKSGVNETNYKVTLMEGNLPCLSDDICQEQSGDGEWNTYTTPFQIDEQSCHLIEYYSIDNVEKTEDVKKQCVFVDNTAPETNKTVGEPKAIWDGVNEKDEVTYFPNLPERCANETCWKVTTLTPITMSCNDPEPHPVDHSEISFNINFDNLKDLTPYYCGMLGGQIGPDGYCTVGDESSVTLYLRNESNHNLKFYCTDALGNQGPEDDEMFKVEGTRFELNLYQKWNLISVPFVLLNNSIENLFKDVKDNIIAVWAYDNGTWSVWTPGPAPDTLNTVKPGWGYWVLSKSREKIWIGGSLLSPVTIPPARPLTAGWNLIGFYGTEWQQYGEDPECSYDVGPIYWDHTYDSLHSLVDLHNGYPRWESLYTRVNCMNDQWVIQFQNDVWNEPHNGKYRMVAGYGYWIHMDEPDQYAP
ncbi:hypothetical protein L6303_04295 [archaeon]|nr:hypothetical protein [Nanoarchaeota archaeon]MBU4451875.1 hypothetical protein [Nanoarchaeota archaeon]MCG2723939.1 hypothetical protein [archaeon]